MLLNDHPATAGTWSGYGSHVRPAPDGLVRWCAGDDLVADRGHCASWWNPAHVGYAYPEITGLLLHRLATLGMAPDRCSQLADALLRDGVGGVRRGGATYTFDTAMALRGLLAHARRSGWGDGRREELARTWTGLLVDAVRDRNPMADARVPAPPVPEIRWSLSFGAHETKVVGALVDSLRDLGPVPGLEEAISDLVSRVGTLQEVSGRFRIHGASGLTNTHSHCYALEGLVMATPPSTPYPAAVHAGVRWLADVQQPNGALLAWHDGVRAFGPDRTDATAQAIRLWMLVDPHGYAPPAAAARDFLSQCWAPPRGLRYGSESLDVSSWATIFAAQALAWMDDPDSADATVLV